MRRRAFGAPPPPPSALPTLDEQQQKLVLLGMGVLGGAAIGWAAVQHMFVRGMEDKERRQLIGFAASVGLTYAAAKLFDIDEKWWNVEKAAEAAEQAYDEWKAAEAQKAAATK